MTLLLLSLQNIREIYTSIRHTLTIFMDVDLKSSQWTFRFLAVPKDVKRIKW